MNRTPAPPWFPPLLLTALFVAIVLLYGTLLRYTFTPYYQGANDFFIPWLAVRALVWEGADPYGPEVTRAIQTRLFGGEAPPDHHQFDFAYPLTVAPLLAPYTALPYRWAQPLWHATLHGLLIAGLLLWARALFDRPLAPLLLVGLGLWGLTFYHAARAFILGQIAVVGFATAAVALWALHERRWVTAGVALAIATVKPQLAFLLVPLCLLLGWWGGGKDREERRALFLGFALALGVLLGLAFLWQPAWPLAWLRRLTEYNRYTSVGQATDALSVLALALQRLGLGQPWVAPLATTLLVAPLGWAAWRQRQHPDWLWLGSAALLVTAWITPRTATTDQTLLLLPLVYLLGRVPRARALLIAIVGWAMMWAAFFATLRGDTEALTMRLWFPLLVALLWLVVRPAPRPRGSAQHAA